MSVDNGDSAPAGAARLITGHGHCRRSMSTVEHSISIDGMTCAFVRHGSEEAQQLDGSPGPMNFATEKARVEYGGDVTPKQLVDHR